MRKPTWLRVAAPNAPVYRGTAALLRDLRISTICRESRCPNKGECFSAGTASLLILGAVCTRACRFCAVGTAGQDDEAGRRRTDERPPEVDPDEPARVAEAVARLALRHVVITSPTRDDLADGGARHFAATVRAVRGSAPETSVEVLIPDLNGDEAALDVVLAACPDVLAHNLETVPRLSAQVRSRATYEGSLTLLRRAAARGRDESRRPSARAAPRPLIKTGLMLGLGERDDEVREVLTACARAGVDAVTLGQYLQPRRECLPVARYVTPEEFTQLRKDGEALGLSVAAGPFVRSSYRAADFVAARRRDSLT